MSKNDLAVLETLPAKGAKKPQVPVAMVPPVNPSTPAAKRFPAVVGVEPVAEFVALAKEVKAKMETLKELERYLKNRGLMEVFARNDGQAAKAQISSVRLADDGATEQDPTAMVSVKDAYAAFDAAQAEALIASLQTVTGKRLKVEDCLDWKVVATFDTGVFNGPKGFDRERYDDFLEAVEAVATRYGVENPLQCGKVRVVKDGFHQERFGLLRLSDNLLLQEVIPATVAIKV